MTDNKNKKPGLLRYKLAEEPEHRGQLDARPQPQSQLVQKEAETEVKRDEAGEKGEFVPRLRAERLLFIGFLRLQSVEKLRESERAKRTALERMTKAGMRVSSLR